MKNRRPLHDKLFAMSLRPLYLFLIFHLSNASDFIPFLRDFTNFKNLMSVWVKPCSSASLEQFVKWRKHSTKVVKLQVIRNLLLYNETADGLMGIALESSDSMEVLRELQNREDLRRNAVVLLWSNDLATAVSTISSPETKYFIYVYAAGATPSFDQRITVIDRQLRTVMLWKRDFGLFDVAPKGHELFSKQTIRGSLKLEATSQKSLSRLEWIKEERSITTVENNLVTFSFILHDYIRNLHDFRWDLSLSIPQNDSAKGDLLLDSFEDRGQAYNLMSSLADVGFYPEVVSSTMLDFVETLPSITSNRRVFVFHHKMVDLEPSLLYTQFTREVWGITGGITVLAIVVHYATDKVARQNWGNVNEPSLALYFVVAVGAFGQQGVGPSLDRLSAKLCHLSLLVLTSLLYMFYSAELFLSLLEPPSLRIDTLKEVQQLGYTIAVVDSAQNVKHAGLEEWGNRSSEIEFVNLTAGVSKLKNGKVALYGYGPNIYEVSSAMLNDGEVNDLRELTIRRPSSMNTFVRKHFLYKELFSRGLLLLREAGILSREDRLWNLVKPNLVKITDFLAESLYSTSLVFIIFFSGAFCSLLLLALELIFHRSLDKHRPKKKNMRRGLRRVSATWDFE